MKEPTADELRQAREDMLQCLKSHFLRASRKESEGPIEELAMDIGSMQFIGNRPLKVGMKMSVQIMIRMGLKFGVLMGILIAERRERQRIDEIREKYGAEPYQPPSIL